MEICKIKNGVIAQQPWTREQGSMRAATGLYMTLNPEHRNDSASSETTDKNKLSDIGGTVEAAFGGLLSYE